MPPIRPELLDELLKDYRKPDDLLGQDGLLQQLTKALVERALDGELTHHLGYECHDSAGDNSGNSRNGMTPKTLRGKRGQVQIDVPRDRASEFEPQLVRKGQTRFDGLDEKIIFLYARGMTQREIQGHLEEIYGVEVSPSLISTVTDGVLDEVRAWQYRPLDAGQCCENYIRAQRVISYLHSGGDLKERSDELRLTLCITSRQSFNLTLAYHVHGFNAF
jgi:putative transposase